MPTTVHSNGSKWAGELPDEIGKLLERLKDCTLDPTFEDYGNFVIQEGDSVTFFGNFLDYSHVFNIETDDRELIETLTAAIRANQGKESYKQGNKRE